VTEIFLQRTFEEPLAPETVQAMARESDGCFGLHSVEWLGSLLSLDGTRMACCFRAPDTESARIALRQAGADVSVLWPGTVVDAPDAPSGPANVLVERSFREPVTIEAIQAIEDAGAWCLETHRVEFARTFFSADRTRMICLYHAPDAESVRLAQRQAGMPVDAVWAFRDVRP